MSIATAVRRSGARSGARLRLAAALLAALPAVAVRLAGVELSPLGKVAVFGSAVVATGFVLAWAAETAQLDISGSLATAVLAVIAVLPEYAVDLYFAFSAGHDPGRAQFAAANMTGSNRLLIGIGWPLVVIVALISRRRLAFRRRGRGDDAVVSTASVTAGSVRMEPVRRIDVGFLAAASIWAIVIVATRQIAWWSSVILVGLFGLYLWRLSREPQSEPELVGVAAMLGSLAPRRRRTVVVALFAVAAVIVLSAAQPFADGLVAAGDQLGIDQFLLVQWVAPLASEAPELIVAGLFAWRLRGGDALGTLLSSKVNQWTLLVGSIPLAYLAGGGHASFTLDARQTEEFLLTATQALLALAVVLDLSLRLREAAALLALFLVQLPFPQTGVRLAMAAVYTVVAATLLVRRRRDIAPVARAVVGSAP